MPKILDSMHACVLPVFWCFEGAKTECHTIQKPAAATLYSLRHPCSTPVRPPALLGLDALLSPLALAPLGFLPFLPSAAFMGSCLSSPRLAAVG